MSNETENDFKSEEEKQAAVTFNPDQATAQHPEGGNDHQNINEFATQQVISNLNQAEADKSPEAEKISTPMQAHQSWKEKIVSGLADFNGKRAETVHFISYLSALNGAFLTAMSNESFNNFYDQMINFKGEKSSPESFLIAGGVTLGAVALLEIGNYITTKIAENTVYNREFKTKEA